MTVAVSLERWKLVNYCYVWPSDNDLRLAMGEGDGGGGGGGGYPRLSLTSGLDPLARMTHALHGR